MLLAHLALRVALALHVGPDGSPPDDSLVVQTERVSHDAVVEGLTVRVDDRWRRWTIEVRDGDSEEEVDVRLEGADGQVHTRSFILEAGTVASRSRQVASALALLVEQIESGDVPPTASPGDGRDHDDTDPVPRGDEAAGWLGVGPRLALNPSSTVAVDAGISLAGGAWLLRSHLQPVAEIAWARGVSDAPQVNALRFGGGLLGGSAVGSRGLWLGGGALVRAQWAHARGASTADGWWVSPAAVAALQYRGRVLVVGGWVGVDLSLPPLVARDGAQSVRWAIARPMATLHIGLRLPPRR